MTLMLASTDANTPISATLESSYRARWWNEPCVYCGEVRPRTQMTSEHVTPACDGGTRKWDNIVTACHQCNHKRGAMPLLMMLLWQSYQRKGITLTKKRRKEMGIAQPVKPRKVTQQDLTNELASVMMGG